MVAVPAFLKRCGVTHKSCSACGEYKHYDEFCGDVRRSDGARRDCRQCQSKDILKYRPNFKGYNARHFAKNPWSVAVAQAKNRAKRKGLEFDLDQHMDAIRARVEPLRCEVSGIPLSLARNRQPDSLSLDRINAARGYTYDNLRVIAWGLNRLFADWGEDAVEPMVRAWIAQRSAA